MLGFDVSSITHKPPRWADGLGLTRTTPVVAQRLEAKRVAMIGQIWSAASHERVTVIRSLSHGKILERVRS